MNRDEYELELLVRNVILHIIAELAGRISQEMHAIKLGLDRALTANPAFMQQCILSFLQKKDGLTYGELKKLTGTTDPRLTRNLERLSERGFIHKKTLRWRRTRYSLTSSEEIRNVASWYRAINHASFSNLSKLIQLRVSLQVHKKHLEEKEAPLDLDFLKKHETQFPELRAAFKRNRLSSFEDVLKLLRNNPKLISLAAMENEESERLIDSFLHPNMFYSYAEKQVKEKLVEAFSLVAKILMERMAVPILTTTTEKTVSDLAEKLDYSFPPLLYLYSAINVARQTLGLLGKTKEEILATYNECYSQIFVRPQPSLRDARKNLGENSTELLKDV